MPATGGFRHVADCTAQHAARRVHLAVREGISEVDDPARRSAGEFDDRPESRIAVGELTLTHFGDIFVWSFLLHPFLFSPWCYALWWGEPSKLKAHLEFWSRGDQKLVLKHLAVARF
jgi:hypothetical protein